MRIIGGAYKGRRIHIGKGFSSRPTTDFAREALFNVLENHFNLGEVNVLDLFGGTGSVSFEFASRGCREVDVVDINGRTLKNIASYTDQIGIKNIHPVHIDAFRFVKICKKKYDIIFADPPYSLKNIDDIPDLIFKNELLETGGWFILEHSKNNDFTDHIRFFDERNYGSVHFSFFR